MDTLLNKNVNPNSLFHYKAHGYNIVSVILLLPSKMLTPFFLSA